MPPDPRDWLPEGHLAWFVLESVEEMDLSAFYGAYRVDGWGRAAFEPSMMVSLLLYAYARGERSSRGIERKCVEDVAYRVIAAQQKPDHATIARFRARHEDALAELFGSVLGLCRQAGLVKVGVIAIDGTKVHANASHHCNLDYEQLAREILKEAAALDAAEDELHGDARGDELPEHLRTSERRRGALREAKERLERDRVENGGAKTETAGEAQAPGVKIELDPEVIVPRTQGREGWLREARRQLDEYRRREAKPIARSRPERLLEAERRLQQDLAVERQANEAYEHYRAHGRDSQGRRLSRPPKPYEPPETPAGKINTTDPDSRNVKTPRSYTQGYNTQAVVNEEQIVLAAEVTASSPDFGHLQPMVEATKRELQAVGVTETPGVAVADSGYWNEQQMDHVVANEHVQVLIPPDAGKRDTPRPGWQGGRYTAMREVLATDYAGGLYRRRKVMVEPVFAQTKHNRRIDSFQRRGRSAVHSEWRLITATHNLLKLHKHQTAAAAARKTAPTATRPPSRLQPDQHNNHTPAGHRRQPRHHRGHGPLRDTHDDMRQRRRLLVLAWPVSSRGDPELEQRVYERAAERPAVLAPQHGLALQGLDGSLHGVLGLAVTGEDRDGERRALAAGDDLGDLPLGRGECIPAGAHLLLGHIDGQARECPLPGGGVGGLVLRQLLPQYVREDHGSARVSTREVKQRLQRLPDISVTRGEACLDVAAQCHTGERYEGHRVGLPVEGAVGVLEELAEQGRQRAAEQVADIAGVALSDAADHRVQAPGAGSAAAVALGAAGPQHLLKLVVAHDHRPGGGKLAGKVKRVEQTALPVLGAKLRTAQPGGELHPAAAARELGLRLDPRAARSAQLALERLLDPAAERHPARHPV